MVLIIIFWIIFSFLVGSMGSGKTIGWVGAFFISLIFSPIIGLLFVIASSNIKVNTIKSKGVLANNSVRKLTSKAFLKYKNNDFDSAIVIFNEALKLSPNVTPTHFYLSCLYSLKENKGLAFKHLSKSVELGYKNFNTIATSKDFDWLRKQPEYNDFALNGYKFNDNQNKDYIDELKGLAELKTKGIITVEEFEQKKKEILNSNNSF